MLFFANWQLDITVLDLSRMQITRELNKIEGRLTDCYQRKEWQKVKETETIKTRRNCNLPSIARRFATHSANAGGKVFKISLSELGAPAPPLEGEGILLPGCTAPGTPKRISKVKQWVVEKAKQPPKFKIISRNQDIALALDIVLASRWLEFHFFNSDSGCDTSSSRGNGERTFIWGRVWSDVGDAKTWSTTGGGRAWDTAIGGAWPFSSPFMCKSFRNTNQKFRGTDT